jgi:6-phosphofructokinase 1
VKIGVLTGGGDCPGLNAVIRAVVKKAERGGDIVLGIKNGWAGLVRGDAVPLTDYAVAGILPKGGTILGTSRTNPLKDEESTQRALDNFKRFGLDAVIAVGGEDTLGAAKGLHERGMPVVGVPKTIDNDIGATEVTFGFDTAVNIVVEAIDRLHSTAESHHRVMVVEVMGRHSGWIAVTAGLAGGADYILVPERPFRIEDVCDSLRRRHAKGKGFSIVVVAEGAYPEGGAPVRQSESVDEFGHPRLGGVGVLVAKEIEQRTGIETRVTILGHIQRGGSPTARDRILATRFGLKAVDLVREGRFGRMVAYQAGQITSVPFEEALGRPRLVGKDLLDDAAIFFY